MIIVLWVTWVTVEIVASLWVVRWAVMHLREVEIPKATTTKGV
jgi:hypothetical protein